MSTNRLRSLEAWFQTVITHPIDARHGAEEAEDIARQLGHGRVDEIVTSGPAISAEARLELYHYAYHARLVECLADDFAAVQDAIGERAFEEIARQYIAAHPSTHPNLNAFGAQFPEFLRTRANGRSDVRFAAELARLEWAVVEAIHAPESAALSAEALASVSAEAWPTLRLLPSSTLQRLMFDYPVNRYFQAYMNDDPIEIPAPEWSAVAVYRQDWRVYRMPLTRSMDNVLGAILRGQPLIEALSVLDAEDEVDPEDVTTWFKEWMASGFFSGLSTPSETAAR
ncbi:MAG: putative DNA-binding domain-containing protein [Deltaproteobacteria bacterium]|nr:putative DNA-binding domain-containing protein [Deltaproteobacteria bacterium]